MSLYLSGGRRTVNTLPDPEGHRIRQLAFNASDAERGRAATLAASEVKSQPDPGFQNEVTQLMQWNTGMTRADAAQYLRAKKAPGAAAGPGGARWHGTDHMVPFLPTRNQGLQQAPNPAYGEAFNLRWDGEKWVPKDPNEDLERQLMELELERRRKEMDEDGGEQRALLKSWLAKRLGGS